MTTSNQDFTSYAGMAVYPQFTIYSDAANTIPLDLSTSTEIECTFYKDIGVAAALIKKKSTGGISFVNTGTDGQIKVNISNSDSAPLDGWYFHSAVVTDFSGNKATVEVGRWAVLQPGPL